MQFSIHHHWHDSKDLRQIARDAYQHYGAEMGVEPAPMQADYAHHLAHDQIYAAVDDRGVLIGFAIVIFKDTGVWLENIAVAPPLMGQGVGTRLLGYIEDDLSTQGVQHLHLYTNIIMRQNIAWYAKQGYHETSRQQDEGYHRVFFRKELTHVSA